MSALPPLEPKLAKEWKLDAPPVVCGFDAAGRHAFAGGEDGAVARFRIADGAKTVFMGHEGWVLGLAGVGDGMVSSASDGKLCWWPAAAGPKPLRTVDAHAGWARCVAASPDGKLIASGGHDRLVKLWSADGKPVRTLAGHEHRVYSVLFHPDGKRLYTGDLLGKVREWDLASGKETALLHAKEFHHPNVGQNAEVGGVRGLALSPDGAELALCGLHRAPNPFAGVWEPLAHRYGLADRKLRKAHASAGLIGAGWRCAYLADGTLMLLSGGNGGGALLFFKPGDEKEFRRFMLPNAARCLALAPDGKHALTAHTDSKLRLVALHG